jgi:hypothetical protein
MNTYFEKDPQSIEPRGFDWTSYLAEIGSGETIQTSTWSRSPSTLTLSGASIVTGGKKTQVMLSGGVLSVKYTVTNHIVTTPSGVEDDRSITVYIHNK